MFDVQVKKKTEKSEPGYTGIESCLPIPKATGTPRKKIFHLFRRIYKQKKVIRSIKHLT